uniref:Uncharacterized protein n=1 Tax=Magnetospirillum gryphiswaldense TaxID=55518 RepID=A4U3A5_9PROT|nr:hypothetical protein MGR_2548 [Magnetospirillum gryphiswaldense MSR-1]
MNDDCFGIHTAAGLGLFYLLVHRLLTLFRIRGWPTVISIQYARGVKNACRPCL